MHRCLTIVSGILFCARLSFTASDYSQCRLVGDKCTYHVTLSPSCTSGETASGRADRAYLNRSEERQLEDVWRDLVSVKADYSRRIEELENRLATLVQGNAVDAGGHVHKRTDATNGGKGRKTGGSNNGNHHTEALRGAPLSVDVASDQTKRHLALNMKDESEEKVEAVLLSQIQKEFSNLRRELIKCKRHWRDADTLLTVTKERLNRTEQQVRYMNVATVAN